MLRSIRDMFGFTIKAEDGDIGTVEDFYFDDERWIIRYCIDKTGGWMNGKHLLIPPGGFDGAPDWKHRIFPLAMTREKVRRSPDISADKPVSRQKEHELLAYYGLPFYWQFYSSQTMPPIPVTPPVPEAAFEELSKHAVKTGEHEEAERGDVHLRSCNEVIGYAIQAIDGKAGGVRDFLVDEEDWSIRFLVADINSWLPGGTVRVDRSFVGAISWEDSRVLVNCTVKQVEKMPVQQ